MAEQIKKEKQESKPQEEVQEDTLEAKDQTELTDEIDDILAEIDSALGDDLTEEEMQSAVDSYRQLGGEAVVCPELQKELGFARNVLQKLWKQNVGDLISQVVGEKQRLNFSTMM